MFTRLTQKWKEKTGHTSGTRYTAEIGEGNALVDATKENTARIISRLEATTTIFGESSTNNANQIEAVTEPMRTLGQRLPITNSYSTTLVTMSTALSQIGALQRKMTKDMHEQVCMPLSDWLKNDYQEIIKQRETLNKRRLDMDAAAAKLAACQPGGKNKISEPGKSGDQLSHRSQKAHSHEQQVRAKHLEAVKEHDKELNKMQDMLEKLAEHHEHHRRCLLQYMTLQRDMFKNIADSISATVK